MFLIQLQMIQFHFYHQSKMLHLLSFLVLQPLVVFVVPAKKCLAHVMINFASFTSLASPTHVLVCFTSYARFIGPTFILVHLVSFVDLTSHVKNHIHDHEIISSDNIVELSDFQFDNPLFVPPYKKHKNEGKTQKNLMTTFANFKLNGQLACHGQKVWCLREGL